ncbi:hypothetical protein Q31b_12830 [Novipirellula aureliae]|uniref:Uncharacterized protein n=1 Tax=Novipirellula aureliae TaxID=2527966 RepID=A0A5C6E281_9BACT|nr:hypothetical protein [Novipirellula aureliae]TWU43753.1 hypothetical protein Q31b_12830 [Novipirellula aureliae]
MKSLRKIVDRQDGLKAKMALTDISTKTLATNRFTSVRFVAFLLSVIVFREALYSLLKFGVRQFPLLTTVHRRNKIVASKFLQPANFEEDLSDDV